MITTLRETSAQKTAIQTITFRVGTCTLGLVLAATTPQGICAILLGSDERALVRHAGYRWGVNRKRLLLQREQELFPDPQSLFAMPALMKGHAPF
jgi:hypothetical protein